MTEQVRSITILGRRWRSRLYGNTYFTVSILINGRLIHRSGMAYGYGSQYKEHAEQWLVENNILPDWNHRTEYLRQYCERKGIELFYDVTDHTRKRDLFE